MSGSEFRDVDPASLHLPGGGGGWSVREFASFENKASTMTILRGFVIALISGVSLAVLGGMAGYLLAILVPDYYRTVFRIPPHAEIDVRHVGLALGITQGFTVGLLVGAGVVVAVAWFNSRMDATRRST